MNQQRNEIYCSHCGKKYCKKASYEKHYVLCDILHKTERERNEENEREIKSQAELIKVIHHLVKKCNQLETKMETVMKWIQKEKKKINVIEWLQNQQETSIYYPEMLFDEFTKFVYSKIHEKHIDIVKQHNVFDSIQVILNESCHNKKLPLCCFSEKQDTLYLCESFHPITWKECDKKTIVGFFNGIQKKLLFLMAEWKKNNKKRFETDDHLCETYNKTMMKLLVSFSEDIHFSKIKRMLTAITKIDVKNIVEYELEK